MSATIDVVIILLADGARRRLIWEVWSCARCQGYSLYRSKWGGKRKCAKGQADEGDDVEDHREVEASPIHDEKNDGKFQLCGGPKASFPR